MWVDRFWAKVDVGDCWEWTAATTGGGYGVFESGGRARSRMAHRIAWELLVGPIPDGLTVDHLCRNRLCVNPDHLEPVMHRENLLRGEGVPARNARKTHCPAGHPLSGANLYRHRGKRGCATCRTERNRARKVRSDD